jgi:crotonobetaine/carnitine-CoA ligase
VGETYEGLTLTFADREEWVLGKVLERRAVTHRDRPCLQWEDGPALTYDQVNRTVNRWAHGLSRAGIAHGDRVMLFLPNCLEYLFAWFALNKLGAVQVPVNTNYRGYFLEHVANNCAARVAIVDAQFLRQFAQSEDAMPTLDTLYVRGRSADAPAFKRIVLRDIGTLETTDEDDPGTAVSCRDIAAILFTSGTTGPSKGVLMPHAHLYFFAEEGANVVRLTDADVYMTGFPLFHGNAQFLTVYPAIIRGAHAVLYESFSATEWIDRVRRTGTTVTNLLGVTMDFVFKQPARPDDADNRLRVIYAAPPAVSIMDDFRRRFGVTTFVNGFGQTEACLPLMTPYDGDRPADAVGKVVAEWFDVRLVDPETDEEVPIGVMGELVVRPRVPWLICAGYNGQPEATIKAMRNL